MIYMFLEVIYIRFCYSISFFGTSGSCMILITSLVSKDIFGPHRDLKRKFIFVTQIGLQ
jgi:hypothetical protein